LEKGIKGDFTFLSFILIFGFESLILQQPYCTAFGCDILIQPAWWTKREKAIE
jgi:hypothetical protein